jgi:murein DD-endopeptidase MepM/ murein hydrolase activator NlpD
MGGSLFFPVVPALPKNTPVLDLSGAASPSHEGIWSIGRYDEVRGIYTDALFAGGRCLHMGIDIGGPVGTAVHAFSSGEVYAVGYNAEPGDYGHVIVTEHLLEGRPMWALFGHLDAASSARWQTGEGFERGALLGGFGDRSENGGWSPHVHVQLSTVRPTGHDMPGAVRPDEREQMLRRYPDPRLVLGGIY